VAGAEVAVAQDAHGAVIHAAAVVARGVDPEDSGGRRLGDDPVDRAVAVAEAAPLERAAEEDDVDLLLDRVADRPPEHRRPAGVEQVELRPAPGGAGDRPDDLGHDPAVPVPGLEALAVVRVAEPVTA